jgi:hypothetical protein
LKLTNQAFSKKADPWLKVEAFFLLLIYDEIFQTHARISRLTSTPPHGWWPLCVIRVPVMELGARVEERVIFEILERHRRARPRTRELLGQYLAFQEDVKEPEFD